MLSCKEISRLVSESLDRDLPLRQRMSVWMHLRMCYLCRRFAKQMTLLRNAIRQGEPEPDPNSVETVALPEPARERIRELLEQSEF